jgi:hypothetical protein
MHTPEVDLGDTGEENADVTTVPTHHDHRDELYPPEEEPGEDRLPLDEEPAPEE